MKYIICDGNRKLKYEQLFSSVEDIIDFLHYYYTFEFLSIRKLHSVNTKTTVYTCSYQFVGHIYTSDLIFCRCEDYVEKEEI